jgi:hypothetical protein
MAAPTNPCYVKILLVNSEPSTHGTFRPFRDVRATVAIEGKTEHAPLETSLYGLFGPAQPGYSSAAIFDLRRGGQSCLTSNSSSQTAAAR